MIIKPVLFFDTFIVDDFLTEKNNDIRGLSEYSIRKSNSIYAFRKKIEVVKYVLTTYSYVHWSAVYINYECENEADTENFRQFCIELFPHAKIVNKRSSTETDYYQSLVRIDSDIKDCWVFFCPNNDHPYIASVEKFSELISAAEKFKIKNPAAIVSILYSHFYESMNSISPTMHLWGYYAGVFPKIIEDKTDYYVVKYNKALLDSVNIFKLSDLIYFFSDQNPSKRVIRIEETRHYLSQKFMHLCIIPKNEICRHFDGYFHLRNFSIEKISSQYLSPLFIPRGFYEKNIKISYGNISNIDDFTNLNPFASKLSFLGHIYFDSNMHINNIPIAWKNRIAKINYHLDQAEAPFDKVNNIENILFSLLRLLTYYLYYNNLSYLKSLIKAIRANKS
jgi:hypothetical protein